MNWGDPTPLWLSTYVPLCVSGLLLVVALVLWVVKR